MTISKEEFSSGMRDLKNYLDARFEQHEKVERLMMEPIAKLVDKHEYMLEGDGSKLNVGLDKRVDRVEQEYKGQKTKSIWMSIPGIGAAIDAVRNWLT